MLTVLAVRSMNTYADFFNASYQGDMPSGPVRITISREEPVADSSGNALMENECCSTEELMDQDETQSSHATEMPRISKDTAFFTWIQPSSVVWVLDTYVAFLAHLCSNILLHTLQHIEAVCNAQLNELYSGISLYPRIYLVLPLVVLEELDVLKTSSRQEEGVSLATSARRASHWILQTVQTQKYSLDLNQVPLPPQRWVLHVQTLSSLAPTSHLVRLHGVTHLGKTNDQIIVALCADLYRRCDAQVMLVSDDTNARTHAELEGISTISLRQVLSSIRKTQNTSSIDDEAYQLYSLSSIGNRHLLTHP